MQMLIELFERGNEVVKMFKSEGSNAFGANKYSVMADTKEGTYIRDFSLDAGGFIQLWNTLIHLNLN